MKRKKLIQQIINVLLLIVVVGLIGFLTATHKTSFDWTYGHRNTLTPASQRLLKALPKPVHFYAFVFPDQGQIRSEIENIVGKYKAFKSNITLTFIDPAKNPQKVKEFKVAEPDQMVVEYDKHREVLNQVSEPIISEALERLASNSKIVVTFLTGDGERETDKYDRNGYSDFAQTLNNKGLKVKVLNLAANPRIPADTTVLVIASPDKQMLPGEDKIIEKYVENGGNLLWLADTGTPPGLPGLAKELGVTWQNGYAVFPNYKLLGTGNPGIYLATNYPPNPITKHLSEITVFPFVRSLSVKPPKGWNEKPLLTTSKSSWLETDTNPNATIEFNPKQGDIAGPLTIGASMTRTVTPPSDTKTAKDTARTASTAKDKKGSDKKVGDGSSTKPRTQHVVLIGDADFLANGNLNVLGNKDLGVSIVNWLAARNNTLSITIPKAPDLHLYLSGWMIWLITGGFIIVLPGILLGIGVVRWIVRRRR